MAGFIDVLLRGLALTGQAVAIGGDVFALVVLRPRQDDSGYVRPPVDEQTFVPEIY